MSVPPRRFIAPAIFVAATVSSSAIGQTQLLAIERQGPANSSLSDVYYQSLAGAGDIDQDGVPDLIWSTFDRVAVCSCATGTVLREFVQGAASYPLETNAMRGIGVGDVSGDGIPDIAIGTAAETSGGGALRIYSGANGAILSSWFGPIGYQLGTQVETAGDVDQDGFLDVIVSCSIDPSLPKPSGLHSEAWVVSGVATGSSKLHSIVADGPQAGVRVGSIGDIDAEGHPDFAVKFASTTDAVGSFLAYRGSDGSAIRSLQADVDYLAGWEFGSAGDVDDDGYGDVLLGSPGAATHPKYWTGVFGVVSGRTGATLVSRDGADPTGWMGFDASLVGDVDGDGRDDFVSTEPNATTGSGWQSGRVHIFVQRGSRRLTSTLFDGGEQTYVGVNTIGVGDVDGDGRSDLAVLDPLKQTTSGVGVVRIVSIDDAAPEPQRFTPGTRLVVGTNAATAAGDAIFDTIAGAKLSFEIESVPPGVTARLVLHDPSGDVVKSWSANHPKKFAAKTKESGTYRITIETTGAAGVVQIKTRAKLPKKITPKIDEVVTKKSGSLEAEFHSIAGSLVALRVVPLVNVDPIPAVSLESADGTQLDLSTFAVNLGVEFSTHPFVVSTSGKYRVRVEPSDAKKACKARIQVFMEIAKGSEWIRIE